MMALYAAKYLYVSSLGGSVPLLVSGPAFFHIWIKAHCASTRVFESLKSGNIFGLLSQSETYFKKHFMQKIKRKKRANLDVVCHSSDEV